MHFVKILNSDKSIHCEWCGIVDSSTVQVELFHNEDKVSDFNFYHDGHFDKGNWNGDMIAIWAYILKELGYKINFTAFLEIYSDTSDFEPHFNSFYSDENLKEIDIHVIYERDFYISDIKTNKIAFVDQPKQFIFSLNQKPIILDSREFEEVYCTIVKDFALVSQIHKNNDYEYDERQEY